MQYKTVSEMAQLWHVSERTVRNYCSSGKILGTRIENKSWKIPADTPNPKERILRPVAIGRQNFADIIEKNCFYVDKTNFIKEWWETGSHVSVILRPRRFGKTLTMSMVEQFFSLRYAQCKLFKNLNIWQHSEFQKLQGTYPVIFLSLAAVKEGSFAGAIERIKLLITDVYNEYAFLLKDDVLSDAERLFFTSVNQNMSNAIATDAINLLCGILYRKYGKKVIVLLDEYDTPMQEAYISGYWKEMSCFIRNFFNSTFKTNPYLERALMTGIARISKESIFSDLNNIEVATIASNKFASSFGFTEQEVSAALEEYGLSDNFSEVKEWYDGFTFGNATDIYNPWSITNYLDKKQIQLYWANTSSNKLVNQIVLNSPQDIKIYFEKLLQGEAIQVILDEQVVFDSLDRNPNAIWSLLLATGYLKLIKADFVSLEYEVALTNKEILTVFKRIAKDWFANVPYDYQAFVNALVSGNEEVLNYRLNNILQNSLSYFDTAKKPENFYHGFVLGLLAYLGDKYYLTSNRESGLGRYDVMLEANDQNDPSIILEFKVATNLRRLKQEADDALKQIEKQQYEQTLLQRGIAQDKIFKYGIAFKNKQAVVKLR